MDELLCRSLLKWLKTFSISVPHENVEDISDGVAMSQCLAYIAPECFNDQWLSKIKTNIPNNNWHLKISNLRKVLQGVLDYYQDTLGITTDFKPPDVNKIGLHSDAIETGRLLQLILGCAVNCEHKEDYIGAIMKMEESVQQVIMQAIQELMSREGSYSLQFASVGLQPNLQEMADSDSSRIRGLLSELEAANVERDRLQSMCQKYSLQISGLQEEKLSCQNQISALKSKLSDVIGGQAQGEGQKTKDLKMKNEALQDELFRTEAARDDLQIRLEVAEKTLADAKSKQEELGKAAEQARSLKDEVDVLRETAERVGKYETTLAVYKKKLEEFGDLKRHIKILEEKNAEYINQNSELEEEIRRCGSWKPQVDVYKQRVAEVQRELENEVRRADKAEVECKRLSDKMQALQREKDRLLEERDVLKETNDELKCAQLQPGKQIKGNNSSDTSFSGVVIEQNLQLLTSEDREQLKKTQAENLRLREKNDQLPALQALLEDLQIREQQLQSENRKSNKRILELEGILDEMQLNPADTSSTSSPSASNLQFKDRRIKELERELEQKELQIQDYENRHQKYLEKARSVSMSLDAVQKSAVSSSMSSNADASTLWTQVQEKEQIIHQMQQEMEKSKAVREMEERLITTAFYNYGIQLQRQAAEQRLSNLAGGQSFLSRQRQFATRRTGQNPSSDIGTSSQ